MSEESPVFLTIEAILQLHDLAIQELGGSPGLRDRAALEAAVYQPQAALGGKYLYSYPQGMAVAYSLGLARNHPFVEGNKRTAAVALGAFLLSNGWTFEADVGDLAGAIIGLVTGALGRADFEAWLAQKLPGT